MVAEASFGVTSGEEWKPLERMVEGMGYAVPRQAWESESEGIEPSGRDGVDDGTVMEGVESWWSECSPGGSGDGGGTVMEGVSSEGGGTESWWSEGGSGGGGFGRRDLPEAEASAADEVIAA